MSSAVTLNHTVFDKWLTVQMNYFCSDRPGRSHPAERGNQQNQVFAGASEKGGQHNHRNQLWKQNEDVDESIEDAAAFSRSERTDDTAQQQCQDAAGKTHQQSLPGSINQLCEYIISQGVGAQQMLRRRRQPGAEHLFLAVLRKKRRKKGGQQEQQQDCCPKSQRNTPFSHARPPSSLTLGSIQMQIRSVITMDTVIMAVVTNKIPCIRG